MADRVGQQLGNYRLTCFLGQGGFADVYLGEHIYLKTQAAIKILKTQLTQQDLQDFVQEAQTIARLRHPHVVRILDFGVDTAKDTPFLVMDYAPHGTLRQRHPTGSIVPLTTIISYIKQVASALQYAHDEKLIHRDVKPDNMLLGSNNEILLSDFGITAVAHSTSSLRTQAYSGTVHYSAPEQIKGRPRPASDQYALGIVVYEWLTSTRPFSGSSHIEIAMQHVSDSPPPLHSKVLTIPSNVEQVVLKALAKDSRQRFGSVQAFATALEQAYQTASSLPVALPTEVPLPHGSSLPTGQVAKILPSQSPLQTNIVTPQSFTLEPTHTITPSNQPFQPIAAATSSSTTPDLPPVTKEPTPTGGAQLSKRRLSRRAVVAGLAGVTGLAVAGGSITLLVLSQKPPLGTTSGTLGRIWYEHELDGWTATWIRRGSSNVFDGQWVHPSGERISGELTISIDGALVRVSRRDAPGSTCTYSGTLDGATVTGTYGCNPPFEGPYIWGATISQ